MTPRLIPLTEPPAVGDTVLVLLGGNSNDARPALVEGVDLAGTGDPADDRVTLTPVVSADAEPRAQLTRSWLTLFQLQES